MLKVLKHKVYWVNTKLFCGAVTVNQDGKVLEQGTAPCYKWMVGKKFKKILEILKFKKSLFSVRELLKKSF